MHFLVYIIIAILVGAIYGFIMRNNAKELLACSNMQHITVHLPKSFGVVGLAESLFFLTIIILFVIFPNDTSSIWTFMGFGLFALLGILLVLASVVWKIHVYKDSDYIVYITFFGRSYKILYSDITYFKAAKNTVFIHVNRKTFYVDREAANIEILFSMFRRYRVKEHSSHRFKVPKCR